MRWVFAITALCAGLWVACSSPDDHCVTYAETCDRWCEGEELAACQAEGEDLAQAGDQAACFDANLRLTCGGSGPDTGDWPDTDDWYDTDDTADDW